MTVLHSFDPSMHTAPLGSWGILGRRSWGTGGVGEAHQSAASAPPQAAQNHGSRRAEEGTLGVLGGHRASPQDPTPGLGIVRELGHPSRRECVSGPN